jgi:hypothetical protein
VLVDVADGPSPFEFCRAVAGFGRTAADEEFCRIVADEADSTLDLSALLSARLRDGDRGDNNGTKPY